MSNRSVGGGDVVVAVDKIHVVIERAGHDNDLWVSSPEIAECIMAFFRREAIPHERIELPPIEFTVPDDS